MLKDKGYLNAHFANGILVMRDSILKIKVLIIILVAIKLGVLKEGIFSYKNPNILDGPKGEYLTDRLEMKF